MKLKSLLFGSAAVFAVSAGAQAADLPMVEPVEYVRICDVFGTGYYYIPGTETCLKIGGYVRAESHYVSGDTGWTGAPANTNLYLVHEGHVNNWTTRVRGQVNFDARTQTDIGLVRAYIAMEMTVGPGATSAAAGTGFPQTTASNPNYSGTGPNLAAAYITITNNWGTYTAGKRGSFFDFWGGDTYGTRLGLQDGTTDTTLFAWTFSGGNGFTFTVSAEDPASSGRYLAGDDDYEGQESPDGVANIRVDQGWGSAQIMGAVRRIHDYTGPAGLQDGTDDTDLGFAVGAGLSLGIPGGWTFNSQGGYSEGMIGYVSGDPGGLGDIDTVVAGGADAGENTSWAVRAGITGPLISPNLNVWLNGTFIHAEEDTGSDEYDFWAIVAGAAYALAPGLTIGPEFAFHSLDMTDTAAGADGIDEARGDYDVWGVMWRINRSF
jgi:Porin subfamily